MRKKQLLDHDIIRLAGCMPQPPDSVCDADSGAVELNMNMSYTHCVSVSQPPAEVCLMDLAWDYPGV